GDRAAPSTQLAEISGCTAAYFGLHDYFPQFMGDAFNIIRDIYVEAGNWETPFRSHICPNGGAQAHPSAFDHFYESSCQFRFIQSLSRGECNALYGRFHRLAFEQITPVQYLLAFFIEPP